MSRVEIAGDPGSEALRIDGHALPFTSATLAMPDRGMPVLTVALPVAGGTVVTLEAAAAVAGPTRDALVAMGWKPPPARPADDRPGGPRKGFMAEVSEEWLTAPLDDPWIRMVHEPTGITADGHGENAWHKAVAALGERLIAEGKITVNSARVAMGLAPWPQDAAVAPVGIIPLKPAGAADWLGRPGSTGP